MTEAPPAPNSDEELTVTWLQRKLCPELVKAAQARTKRLAEENAEEESGSEPDTEGVAAPLEIAEDAVDDERERGRALDAKMASLVGFTGLIL